MALETPKNTPKPQPKPATQPNQPRVISKQVFTDFAAI